MSKGKWMTRVGVLTFIVSACIALVTAPLWAAPITIKFATGMPPDEEEALHRGAAVFKKMIEQRAPGRLKVDIYPSNQLGNEREQFEGVKLGTIEMCWIAEGPMAGFFPEIMVLGIPYLYGNEATAFRSLDGPFAKALMEEMRKKTGVRSGDRDFGPDAAIDYDELVLRWMDRHVRGRDNGVEREARVKVFVMGDNRWREADWWPLPGTRAHTLFLAGGARAGQPGALDSTPPAQPRVASSFVSDTSDPVTDPHDANTGPHDYAALARRPDALADLCRGFPVPFAGDFPEFHLRHFHVQVNAVEQGPGNAGQLVLNFTRSRF